MERTTEISDGTPMDMNAIDRLLRERKLTVYSKDIRILLHDRGLPCTYEAVISMLEDPSHINSCGRFEIIAADLPFAQSLFGIHPDNPHPTRMIIISPREHIQKVVAILKADCQETRQRIFDVLEKED